MRLFIYAILLAGFCAGQKGMDPALAKRIGAYLDRNREVLDLTDGGARFQTKLLDTGDKQVILLGERHGIAVNEELDLALLRYLHKTAGVRVYLWEGPYSVTCLLNRYLETGDERVLDFVMQEAFGSLGWSRERRNFYVALRRWNLTLPEKGRIRLVGVDVEHLHKVALRYLAELAKPDGGKPAAAIAEIAGRLQGVEQEPSGKAVTRFIADLASSVAAHRADYAAMLGDRLFDFELTTMNLQKTLEYESAKGTPRSFDLREQVMLQTFLKLYPRLGGAKCYGKWGSAHIFQGRMERGVPFAGMLNRPDSPVAGKVLSICALYVNSEAFDYLPGSPTRRADSIAAWSQPFAAVSSAPLTLFKLTGTDSPFQQDRSLMGGQGVPADYVQYVVLIRNAKASHPLEAHRLLGITVRAAAPERGVVVASVIPRSLAARDGIRTGDIITALNGTLIDNSAAFDARLESTAAGTSLTLSIIRDGEKRELTVRSM